MKGNRIDRYLVVGVIVSAIITAALAVYAERNEHQKQAAHAASISANKAVAANPESSPQPSSNLGELSQLPSTCWTDLDKAVGRRPRLFYFCNDEKHPTGAIIGKQKVVLVATDELALRLSKQGTGVKYLSIQTAEGRRLYDQALLSLQQ